MLVNWKFDNSYLKLPEEFYSIVKPDKLIKPKIILFNKELSKDLNLNTDLIHNTELALILSAQKYDKKYKFFSQAYAGHQFGYFTNLGDGRALFLGEYLIKNQRYDIQLKGSGKTPYSRNGDGKASLGPMIREYIISESMHYLNIPTTRSLAVLSTGEKILREKFLPGAILTRVAKSHIRIGTFQYANLYENKNYIKDIADYTINRHFPQLNKDKNKIEKFLKIVLEKQVKLVVDWMRVGFIHGVMNTDNVSIVGETIDYGPCAFMDEYNPKTVFSSIDKYGRYAYENQPKITLWNLTRFAESLLFLLDKDEKKAIKKAENILNLFQLEYKKQWLQMMKAKLSLFEENIKDIDLINELLNIMHLFKLDYTNTFIEINNNKIQTNKVLKEWTKKYYERKEIEKTNLKLINQKINPILIPRNHIIENIIKESENNNFQKLYEYLYLIKQPYQNKNLNEYFTTKPKESEKIKETYCGT